MKDVYAALLDIVAAGGAPEGFVSSYWRQYGERNVAVVREGRLDLRAYGIGEVERLRLPWRLLRPIERMGYRRVTRGLRAYPDVWRAARRLASDLRLGLTFDVWKYAVVASILEDHWGEHGLQPARFAMIGDGQGFLGALLRRMVPRAQVFSIDLPKTLLFQARMHEAADPAASVSLLGSGCEGDVTLVLPQNVESIAGDLDCAVNMSSMQEMNPATIEHYFRFLRRRSSERSRFFCLNRTRKELPDGEVAAFHDYPWADDDVVYLDGPCPYARWFLPPPLRYGHGPRVLGVRIPFVNHFEGDHRHRLACLARRA